MTTPRIVTTVRPKLSRILVLANLTLVMTGLALAAPASAAPAAAAPKPVSYVIELPGIPGWYKGEPILYLQTEASDAGLAASQQANYVARLANAANTAAVDDIYAVTNFKQSNIVPSAPLPAGPGNTDPNYTPLWQVTTVTWVDPTHATLLKSEEEVLSAESAHLVTLSKTGIVVNCSIIYSPQGGLFPQARILVKNGDN